MKRLPHLTWWPVALLAAASAACAHKDDRLASNTDRLPVDSTMTASLPDSNAFSAYSPLTDERIAWMLRNANSTDSALGAQAERLAKNHDVREFGEHMVKDHGKNNHELLELLKKEKIVAAAAPDSALNADEIARFRSQLDTTKTFDVLYINRVADMHRMLLQKLDSSMIPDVKNHELKEHLQETRPHVAEHLKRAEELQAKLSRANTNGTSR